MSWGDIWALRASSGYAGGCWTILREHWGIHGHIWASWVCPEQYLDTLSNQWGLLGQSLLIPEQHLYGQGDIWAAPEQPGTEFQCCSSRPGQLLPHLDSWGHICAVPGLCLGGIKLFLKTLGAGGPRSHPKNALANHTSGLCSKLSSSRRSCIPRNSAADASPGWNEQDKHLGLQNPRHNKSLRGSSPPAALLFSAGLEGIPWEAGSHSRPLIAQHVCRESALGIRRRPQPARPRRCSEQES